MATPFSSLLSGIGLGAGLMYFCDPDLGRRRRKLFLDQCYHAMRELNDAADATCKDLANRSYGTYAQWRSSAMPHDNSDTKVIDRVRSKLGHVVSHPSAIKVTAHDGEVTLSGHILAPEARRALSTTQKVIGVNRVRNYLEPHDASENIPDLQG